MLIIYWQEGESKGYSDLIPADWLNARSPVQGEIHTVIGTHGAKLRAQCDIKPDGEYLELDYAPYHTFNTKRDVSLGQMRISFEDSNRSLPTAVLWRNSEKEDWEACQTTIRIAPDERPDFEASVQKSMLESGEARRTRLRSAGKLPLKENVTVERFVRNPDVVAEVLIRADGRCDECRSAAPFISRSTNQPYLEVHHVTRLADGGEDTVDNAVALCPNCHRKAHYG